MARTKQATPLKRGPSSEQIQPLSGARPTGRASFTSSSNQGDIKANGKRSANGQSPFPPKEAGMLELVFCIGGIYASFLSWALLQERITTTPYGPANAQEIFRFPVFLNTLQSFLAACVGWIYLRASSARGTPTFPSLKIVPPLLLVALTSSLASPFGYASLAHIDYLTFILAKSCKLLPVMALHLTIFRKRYPLSKYLVVGFVTLGVAVFTLYHPTAGKKGKARGGSGPPASSSTWGLFLLGINLLFDGLTNSTQDHIFTRFQPFSGPQMMCSQNILNTSLTLAYLLLSPYIGATSAGAYLGIPLSKTGHGEITDALAFIQRHPVVGRDVLAFAACGAVGQVFIFTTLAHFSSLLLVTVTVTRKMLTMMLSVVWFGHRLSGMQWLGVGLVFGGVGAEGIIQKREKAAKAAKRLKEEIEQKLE
ncbi:MAG: UDP-galactose transporter [Vezdaea aestivalis]|nr:MAG: UDP-galactose transporter [Vezdaea aestivalis]